MSLPVAVGSRARQEERKRGWGERERERDDGKHAEKESQKNKRSHTRHLCLCLGGCEFVLRGSGESEHVHAAALSGLLQFFWHLNGKRVPKLTPQK